jgi:hypothetical protein
MLKFVLLKPSFTSINCNDEINNQSFQTISNSCLISLPKKRNLGNQSVCD